MNQKTVLTGIDKKTPWYAGIVKTIKKDWLGWLLLAPCVIIFIVYSVQPKITTLWVSFCETQGIEAVKFIGLDNYINIITDSKFITTVINTFEYVFWVLIFGSVPPIFFAIFLNEVKLMKGYLRASFYMPSMIPGVATSMMWAIMLDPSDGGLFNVILNKIGLPSSQWLNNPDIVIPVIVATMAWSGLGSKVILYLADLQSVNNDLYEAATLDGAGIFRRVWNITVPHMSGLIAVQVLLAFINSFQIYNEPLAMTGGGPGNASLTMTMLIQRYAFEYFRADMAAATGMLTALALGIFSIFYFKLAFKDNEGGA